MIYKGFKMYCFFMMFLSASLFFLILTGGWKYDIFLFYFSSWGLSLDYLSWLLVFLVLVLLVSVMPLLISLKFGLIFVIFGSALFSMFSFLFKSLLAFWFCYEASMMLILVLMYLDSPYSERFLAGWYLMGYAVFSGLPLLWMLIYFWLMGGVSSFTGIPENSKIFLLFLICFLFSTKIPFFPFHTWLPVVHAEASSVVSVCLSGYMMKLGVIGAIRSSYFFFPDYCGLGLYSIFVFMCCIGCFFSCLTELDGKRWLAFLSLAHMGMVMFCYLVGKNYGSIGAFSLGHGLSAGILFMMIWYLSTLGGSRKMVYYGWVLKSKWYNLFMGCICFCLCASFPPVINFFMEAWLISGLMGVSFLLVLFMLVYLMFSSLVPMIVWGSLYIRRLSFKVIMSYKYNYVVSFMILVTLSLLPVLVK